MKWEYNVVDIQKGIPTALAHMLSSQGALGWELVSAIQPTLAAAQPGPNILVTLIFKKPAS